MKRTRTIDVIIICAAFILFSCNSQSTDQKVIGKWSVENMEKINGDSSNIAMDRKDSKGVSINFKKDGSCYSTKLRIDTLGTGKFEMVNNGKSIILHMNEASRPDTLDIQEIKDGTMKVKSQGTIVTLKKGE